MRAFARHDRPRMERREANFLGFGLFDFPNVDLVRQRLLLRDIQLRGLACER